MKGVPVIETLKKIYPGIFLRRKLYLRISDIKWKEEWFIPDNNWWDSLENQRKFLDKIAKKHEISSLEDWKKIPWKKLTHVCFFFKEIFKKWKGRRKSSSKEI
jgi:hypothetical protein